MKRRGFIAACGALVLAPWWPKVALPKKGTTYTWQGGNGKWDDPRNWKPYGTPRPADSVVIQQGHLEIPPDTTVHELILKGGSLSAQSVHMNYFTVGDIRRGFAKGSCGTRLLW